MGELVLWYGMFAPYRRSSGTTGFVRGAPFEKIKLLSPGVKGSQLVCVDVLWVQRPNVIPRKTPGIFSSLNRENGVRYNRKSTTGTSSAMGRLKPSWQETGGCKSVSGNDTMENIDLDYGAAVSAIAIETIARLAAS